MGRSWYVDFPKEKENNTAPTDGNVEGIPESIWLGI